MILWATSFFVIFIFFDFSIEMLYYIGMEISNQKIEQEPEPRDVSSEFLNMNVFDFADFLRTLQDESSLSIKIDWVDIYKARRLKAFLENFDALGKQKRTATIRATKEQHDQEMNVFASGVKWEKV